jgi:hypothetical protein
MIVTGRDLRVRAGVADHGPGKPEQGSRMRYYLLGAVFALAFSAGASTGFADDCLPKLTSQQRDIYTHLSAENQTVLTSQLKTRNGKPASCEFRGGLMDMLANFPPEKRNSAFKMLVDKMLIRQQ